MPLTKSSRKSFGGRDNSPEPGPSKGDKCSSDEDDEPVPRKGKGYQNSKNKQGKLSKKSPNVTNKQSGLHSSHIKTAELFRKDLISAMKMADTETLYENDYFVISDPWRQEWEKGVQVPVNEGQILPTEIRELRSKSKQGDFKLPPRKYLHEKTDETYQANQHELTNMQEVADAIVRYDLDDQDVTWLDLVNEDREEMGLQLINEWNLERMIEELENQCYVKTNALKKTEEGLGIEYDEDVACDVCRMLESEDTNEMVFCDGCDICVHQACYGIQTIPEGSWLCRICALGIKPMCLLCPKRGGAMKSTKSGTKWTHVSCALWIPEVSIGCPEKMEPITKISNIPPSRWALVCCLCKERVGACIQCSVKQCKTAFHVTCGFAHNLDMKTIVDDSDEADGIHLRAYCPKHTKNRNASDSESPKKEDFVDNENDISEAEMAKKRSEKLKQLEEDFFSLVDVKEISSKFFIPEEAVDIVAEYWKLKRKVNNNKPLITPKMEEEDQMQKQQQDSLSARMKMFVHLRQDLERARNLCYMISKREKNKRQLFKMKESVFHAQIRVLTDPDLNLSARDAEKVRQEYYFDSIYNDYGVLSARSSKQPRENLFTLENLKTPKDFDESDFESGKKDEKTSSKSVKLGKSLMKKEIDFVKCSRGSPPASVSDKCEGHQRDSLFSVDSFKLLNDSTAESSEDESLATLAKSTHSSQMSRLGKVKLKEIEEKGPDGEVGDIKTIPESPTKKFVPPSDLRKKLTSILQSKNMMHQRNEKVHSVIPESVKEVLHVDVNSDNDIFTSDTNTDLMSPTDQPRNLFDQFSLQGKSILSSPCIPKGNSTSRSGSHVQHRKYKTKRHSHSPRKHKKSRLPISPSDQSSTSSIAVKQDSTVSVDGDSTSAGRVSHLVSDDTDVSSLSPTLTADASDLDYLSHSHSFNSLPQSGKGKKRKLPRDISTVEYSGKSLRSLTKIIPQLSPSPRVNPDDIYATIDGDIYVPSGKIQVTERNIILDDPVEEDQARPRSKLRLKKQANSPVKGIISYEVVKDEDDRHDIFEDKKPKCNDEEKRNIFDSVQVEHSDKKAESEVSSFSPRSLRKHKKLEDSVLPTTESKVSEKSVTVNTEVTKEGTEQGKNSKKDLFNVGNRRKRSRSKAPLATMFTSENNVKKGDSTDENFKPKVEPSKTVPPLTRRTPAARRVRNDDADGDDESEELKEGLHSRKKCTNNRAAANGEKGYGIVLKPLPNKPALTALHDSRQLIVKEDVKKRVVANLDKIVRVRSRWGVNGIRDSTQTTIDRFMKRTSSSENVFSKPDVIRDPSVKRLSLPIARNDLTPLRVNKSSSMNTQNDVCDFSCKTHPVSMSPAKAAPTDIFGAHSSSRSILSNYHIPRPCDSPLGDQNVTQKSVNEISDKKSDQDMLFGDVDKLQSPGLKEQLSFEDVSRNADLTEVVKTPPKCDPAGLNEDKLDGHRSYRSQSPPSSEGSCASSRILLIDSRESTPSRRITRSHNIDDSQSPGTRSRTRDSLLKASQLKFS